MKKVIKQFISTVLGVAITSSSVPFTSVQAEEIITEKYPYTLFAGSSDEGAININSNNVCINGNIATNGTITTTAGNFNINGIKAENVDEPIINFFNKLDTAYFDTSATATYSEDYFCEETNININTPIEAEGDITLKGNINISSGLKALNDVNLSGNVENTQHSAISSQTGDIIINTDNVNLNGIVYAPYGCVNISAMNLNMNSVIIIADKINISCPNFNANYNIQMGEFIGLESEETEYDTELNDSDKDGLPDIFETKLGTDIEDSDTDGDELTDYEEFFITGTDPTIYDSVHKGISDSDADCDEDGLCNIDEIARGTDPRDSDTDLDGLTDYDEIFIYNTDPLVADSDNDSIDDGSEVKLGLDPNNALTYGIPDGEYKISQVITADNEILSAFNTEESPYTLSIEMKTNRDIEKEISVSNSGYSNVISNDAMIGASLDILLSDNCDPEDIVLRYDIKERATENTLDKYSSLSELQGIRRLNVFRFDEEERMLIPVETKFSEDNKQLYAEVDELGTYCIMDMEIWLNELGVEMHESVDPAISLNQMSNIQIMAAAPKNTGPLYLLFMLQTNYIPVETAASYEQKLNSEINTIKLLSKYAFEQYKPLDVHVQVLTYTDITASPMLNSKGENYFTDYNELCSNLDTIQYRATLSEANRKNAYMMAEIKCEVLKHPNTFACLFTNSYTVFSPQISNGYFFDDALYWSKWQTVKTYCSRVYLNKEDFKRDSPYFFDIKEIYENAQDEEKEFAPIETALDTSNDSNYEALRDCLIKHVEHLYGVTAPKEDNSFDIIVPTRWKKITLKGTLSPDNGIDTDGDTLTDWEEVDTTKIKINTDNSIELPTFTIAAMVEHLSRFNSADYNFLTRDNAPRLYLPIISDPTMIDSDGDELDDCDEYYEELDALNVDSDGDKLSDGYEDDLGFDPSHANPDGDSYDDYQELENDTNPFVYDLNVEETIEAFSKGLLLGDFEVSDNIETLLGQITGAFIPYIDARDYFANVFVNLNTKDALWNVAGLMIDIVPIAGEATDTTKAISKLERFAVKYADDAPKVLDAITKASKLFPESEKVVPALANVLPSSALDNLVNAVKSGENMTASDYNKIVDLCKAAGKNVDEIEGATKFRSFRALKKHLGDPGTNKQWHHIVEQCQAKKRRSAFDIKEINSVSNVRATPKEVHKEISRYYSSHQPFAEEGKTVRDWLNGQSYEKQYEFGLEQWEKFMKQYGYSID